MTDLHVEMCDSHLWHVLCAYMCVYVCQMTLYASGSASSWTVVDVTVLRIIRHNEVKQTCTETSSHPSQAACAQDVVTVQHLKNRIKQKKHYLWLHSKLDSLKPSVKTKNIIYIFLYIISPHKLALYPLSL